VDQKCPADDDSSAMAKAKQHKEFASRFNPDLPIAEDFNCNEDWRFELPVWDAEKCIKCGVCYLSCPDGAIYQNEEGYYTADLRFCKGCALCSAQCWTGCIAMQEVFKRFPWQTR